MPEFLQLIESIRSEEASVQRLFGSEEGDVSVREALRRRQGPQYKQRLLEAAQFTAEVFSGRRAMWQLREALSTSDFPIYFGDTLDRLVLQEYREAPSDWRQFLRTSVVRDFRTVDRYRFSDGDQVLDRVAQGANYPAGDRDEASYSFRVNKYGRRIPILWEALVNDDLDALRQMPSVLGRAARRTENRFASSLYVANAALYNGGFGNVDTAVLSLSALEAAYNAMAGFRDANGEPIFNRPAYLVVDPVLELTAQRIVGTMQVQWIGTPPLQPPATAVAWPTDNVMRGRLQILVDPYISVLDPVNGATSWYLFADPREGHAAEVAFLSGYEEPQLFMKASNQIRLGAGPTDPVGGDYDTDAVDYKVRHVVGGASAQAVGNWRFTYWSNGTV